MSLNWTQQEAARSLAGAILGAAHLVEHWPGDAEEFQRMVADQLGDQEWAFLLQLPEGRPGYQSAESARLGTGSVA